MQTFYTDVTYLNISNHYYDINVIIESLVRNCKS